MSVYDFINSPDFINGDEASRKSIINKHFDSVVAPKLSGEKTPEYLNSAKAKFMDGVARRTGGLVKHQIQNSMNSIHIATLEEIEKEASKGKKGFVESLGEVSIKGLAPYSANFTQSKSQEVYEALDKFRKNGVLSEEEGEVVRDYYKEKISESVRGRTIMGDVVKGVEGSIQAMLEFYPNVGVGFAVAARTPGPPLVRTVAGATAAMATYQAASLGGKTNEEYYRRLLNEEAALTEFGKVVLKNKLDEPAKTVLMMKAMATQGVEFGSEFVLGPAGKIVSKIPGVEEAQKVVGDAIPDVVKKVADYLGESETLKRLGVNGFITEMAEERLEDALKHVLRLDDYEGPITTESLLNAMNPEVEGFLAEAITIGVIKGGSAATIVLGDKLSERYKMSKQQIVETLSPLDEADIREALAEMTKQDAATAAMNIRTKAAQTLSKSLSNPSFQKSKSFNEALDDLEKTVTPDDFYTFLSGQRPTDKALLVLHKNLADVGALKNADGGPVSVESDKYVPPKQGVFEDIVQGRVEYLMEKVKTLDAEMLALLQTRDKVEAAGRKTGAIDKKIDAVQRRIDEIDASISGLVTEVMPAIKKRSELKISAERLGNVVQKNAEVMARAAFRVATARGKTLNEVKSSIRRAVQSTKLGKQVSGKLMARIEAIGSVEAAKKALPEIESKVISEIRKIQAKRVMSAMKKMLDSAKVSKKMGAVKGKLTPATQAIVDRATELTKLTKTQAMTILEQGGFRQDDGTILPPSPLESIIIQYKAEALGDNLYKATQVFDDIADVIAEGREVGISRELNKELEFAMLKEKTLSALTGDEKTVFKTHNRTIFRKKLAELEHGFIAWAGGFRDFLNIAMRTKDRRLADQVMRDMSFFDELLATRLGTEKRTREFLSAVQDAYPTKLMPLSVLREHRKRFVFTDSGFLGSKENVFVGSDGQLNSSLKGMTRAQAIQLIAVRRNPQMEQRLIDPKGNNIPANILDLIEQKLDKGDKILINNLIKFYDGYYPEINRIHGERFGVDLPKVDNYVPVSSIHQNEQVADSMGQGQFLPGLSSPSFIKQRTNRILPLDIKSYDGVAMSFIQEAEHFINTSEKASRIYRVFQDIEVQKAVLNNTSQTLKSALSAAVKFHVDRGRFNAELTSNFLDALLTNAVIAALSVKPKIALGQLTSFPMLMQDVSILGFTKGLLHGFAHPDKVANFIANEPWIKNRFSNIQNLERAVMDASSRNASDISIVKRFPTLTNLLMLNVRLGDVGAVVMGAYARSHALQSMGMKAETAIKSSLEIARDTQQSSDFDTLSAAQRSKTSIIRAMIAFTSSTNFMMRNIHRSFVSFRRGRISAAEFSKRLAAGYVVSHLMFVMVQTAGSLLFQAMEGDEDEQTEAAKELAVGLSSGFISGVPLYGQAINGLIFLLNNGYKPQPFIPLSDMLYNAESASRLVYKDWGLEDIVFGEHTERKKGQKDETAQIQKARRDFLKLIGGMTGLPAEQADATANFVYKLVEGNLEPVDILRVGGYTPYQAKNIVERFEK